MFNNEIFTLFCKYIFVNASVCLYDKLTKPQIFLSEVCNCDKGLAKQINLSETELILLETEERTNLFILHSLDIWQVFEYRI